MPEIKPIDMRPKDLNLYEVRLPAGDYYGFSIDFDGDHQTRYDSRDWLGRYDGVRLIGKGRRRTRIVPPPGYHDSTVFVGPHAGVVQLENLSIHTANRKAAHFGLENAPRLPEFGVRMRNVDVVADMLPDGKRPVWGLFTYACDDDLEDVRFVCENLNEHAAYHHGYADRGSRWVRVYVESSGAECDKHATRTHELTFAAKHPVIYREACVYQDWYQPHSWRGGAGIVMQGSGADLVVEGCEFRGGPTGQRSRCIMVDDDGGRHFGDYANGNITVRSSGLFGHGQPGSITPLLRVGGLGGPHPVARSLTVEGSALYGEHTYVQVSGVADVKIRNCNTPQIREFADARGFDTATETGIPLRDRVAPISEGYTVP